MTFEWIEDDLMNDEGEMERVRAAEKAYRKQKRKDKTHSINRQYRGEENETLFRDYLDYLYECGYVQYYKWLSYHEKSEYDFEVQLPNFEVVYIDVVGSYINKSSSIRLNCKHKDYKPKLKILNGTRGYLAFVFESNWRFIQVSRHLPKGDLTLTSGRNKHIRKASYVMMNPGIPGICPDKPINLLKDSDRNHVNMPLSQLL